jgi:phosphoglycolate phosphatase
MEQPRVRGQRTGVIEIRTGKATVAIDLVIFDKDGTLVDLHAPWGRWAEHIAERLAQTIAPDELLRRIGWDSTNRRIQPETPLAIAPVDEMRAVLATMLHERGLGWTAATAAARAAMTAIPVEPAPPLCPLQPLFEHLRANHVQIAIVTTDEKVGVVRDLEPLGLLPSIAMIFGSDAGLPVKPAPDIVLAAVAQTGIPASRVAVIGDSVADLAMGRAAGAGLAVGVLSGSGTADILTPHADVLLPSVCALLEVQASSR